MPDKDSMIIAFCVNDALREMKKIGQSFIGDREKDNFINWLYYEGANDLHKTLDAIFKREAQDLILHFRHFEKFMRNETNHEKWGL